MAGNWLKLWLVGGCALALVGCPSTPEADPAYRTTPEVSREPWFSAPFAAAPTIAAGDHPEVPLVAWLDVALSESLAVVAQLQDGDRVWEISSKAAGRRHRLLLLGMRPESEVSVTIVALGPDGLPCGQVEGLRHKTPALPPEVPKIQVTVPPETAVEPGHLLFNVYQWRKPDFGLLLVVDRMGQILWSYHSRIGQLGDVRLLPNGNLLFIVDKTRIVEIDWSGQIHRQWHSKLLNKELPGSLLVETDTFHHEAQILDSGNLLTLSTEARILPGYPTSETDPAAPTFDMRVVGDVAVEFSQDGAVVYSHSLMDVLDTYRLGYQSLSGFWNPVYRRITADWSHANAIIVDPKDGDWVISVRHMAAIIKIDRETGALCWILGDPVGWKEPWQSRLLKAEGPLIWPYHPHAPMFTPDGNLLLFDNGNYRAMPYDTPLPPEKNYSRAVEYAIDESAMTVREVWSYGGPGGEVFYSPWLSDADVLPQTGHVLITDGGRIENFETKLPDDDIPEGRHSARILEVTRQGTPQKLFELWLDEPDKSWAIYRADIIPFVDQR